MAMDNIDMTIGEQLHKKVEDELLAQTLSIKPIMHPPTFDFAKWKNAIMSFKSLSGENDSENKSEPTPDEPVEPEEWIWITGCKGTNSDMTCRDYQYELGKLYKMPDDAVIEECKSGFHLCKELKHVYDYYEIGNGRRFFEVQAQVRKTDFERYGETKLNYDSFSGFYFGGGNKLVAKSIVFTREMTADEVFEQLDDTDAKSWTTEQKEEAMQTDIPTVRKKVRISNLVELGYSEAFSTYIVEDGEYDAAMQVGSQKDLSMDMKVLAIINGL